MQGMNIKINLPFRVQR